MTCMGYGGAILIPQSPHRDGYTHTHTHTYIYFNTPVQVTLLLKVNLKMQKKIQMS